MAEVIEEEEVVVEEPAPTPEGTPLEPTDPPAEGAVTLESLHAMFLEIQGQVANLQAVADQATPVEPAAEEVPEEEEPAADDSALLEDDGENAPAPEQDLEELDSMLSGN